MKIATSFLSIKNDLEENLNSLANTNCDYLHVDIMDGRFVSNKTWDALEIYELTKNISKPLDVHLMVEDVEKYVDDFIRLHPEYITFHIEACSNPSVIIEKIHQNGIKAGISIKPNTEVDSIIPYLVDLDLVLVMSVEPGMGGQKFMSDMVAKINQLKCLREKNEYNFIVEVDGGINDETISEVKNADMVVVGSFITNSDDYQKQINTLRQILE